MKDKRKVIAFVVVFALVGVVALVISRAATPSASFEAENATTIAGCVTKVSDATASGSASIKFGSSTGCGAGANLPIIYEPETLPATAIYMAPAVATPGNPAGDDNTGNGTKDKPYATLTKAISVTLANGTIVVRGGTYREGGLALNKTLKIIAYTGEIPVFNGAQPVSSDPDTWVLEGIYKYIAYIPQPVTDGSGINFLTATNNPNQKPDSNGFYVGKYPDQAWIGDIKPPQQVPRKEDLAAGKFWVDSANGGRLYMIAADANESNIEVSQKTRFMKIGAPDVIVEGLRVMRFSNSANDYGVFRFEHTGDNSLIRHVEIIDASYISISYSGSPSININSTMDHVTITGSNWMGVSAAFTDNLKLDNVKITGLDRYDEFKSSPQSGALKTSRTWDTKVINSEIRGNKSHGLWFDQSNYRVVVANNQITGNEGAGVFFEISDDLLLINNYISAPGNYQAAKLAGSSGLKLVNNTFVGGTDPIGIYAESRSGKPLVPNPLYPIGDALECYDPDRLNYGPIVTNHKRAGIFCGGGMSSDIDQVRTRPLTMDWKPRIDLMINNIIAYPTGSGLCDSVAPVCILTVFNSTSSVTMGSILHQANTPYAGVPKTLINGNVYVDTNVVTNNAIMVATKLSSSLKPSYSSLADFVKFLTDLNLLGLEAAGKYGDTFVNADGSPKPALIHSGAVPIDASVTAFDSNITRYICAGTKHYGYNVTNPKPPCV